MTDPLTQPLFPDIEEEPYVLATEVDAYIRETLVEMEPLTDLRSEMAEKRIRLAGIWDTKPFDPLREEMRPHTFAKAMKAPAVWKLLSGFHGAVVVRRWLWNQSDERARRAVVYHELLHFQVAGPGELKVRQHDLEEFALVVRRWGSWSPDRSYFFKQWALWSKEQDEPAGK